MLASLTSPAYAEKHKIADARGDVLLYLPDLADEAAPEVTQVDIVRSVTNHRKGLVTMKLVFDDLTSPTEFDHISVYADIATPRQRHLLYFKQDFDGTKRVVLSDRKKRTAKCSGLQTRFSAAKDLIKFSIPRRCLGKPRWVKVSMTANYSARDFNPYYWDNNLSIGEESSAAFGHRPFTPRLKRG